MADRQDISLISAVHRAAPAEFATEEQIRTVLADGVLEGAELTDRLKRLCDEELLQERDGAWQPTLAGRQRVILR